LAKLSSPTTLVVQANLKKHLETVPTKAIVTLDAARHGKLGPVKSVPAIEGRCGVSIKIFEDQSVDHSSLKA
jgi:hypothetical protein